MPLKKGSSREIVGSNIEELVSSGKPRAQAIAIALDKAGIDKELTSKNYNSKIDETTEAIDRKNTGGNLKDKGSRKWPRFK